MWLWRDTLIFNGAVQNLNVELSDLTIEAPGVIGDAQTVIVDFCRLSVELRHVIGDHPNLSVEAKRVIGDSPRVIVEAQSVSGDSPRVSVDSKRMNQEAHGIIYQPLNCSICN